MAAACSVEMKPQIMALWPMREMGRVREGARAESTPIWTPSEPRFEKPQSVRRDGEAGRQEGVGRGHRRLQVQVRHKFVFDQLCREHCLEMRRISGWGTPQAVWKKMGRVSGRAGGRSGGRTEEECDGVEDVTQDGDSEM
jgi:hypothetical protein